MSSCAAGDAGSGPGCFDSLDCPTGWMCDPVELVCKKVSTPQTTVDFELTPLKGSGGANTQIPNKDLAVVTSDIRLDVAPAITVAGQVTSKFAPGGVPGTLVISRAPQIDNRRLVWNINVPDSGDYRADLTPGVSDILFKPSNRADFPQFMLEEYDIPDEPAQMHSLPLTYPEYPEPETLLEQPILMLVRGQVHQSQAYPHPVTGINVEGLTEHGLLTNKVTPDEQGYFLLRLPAMVSIDDQGKVNYLFPQSLDIVVRPESSEVRLPTVSIPGLELDNPELGTFYIGEVPESRSISGEVVDSQGNPIAECQLRFESDGIGNGTFIHQKLTDAQGQFTTNLPIGSYQLMVVPSLGSDSALLSTDIELTDNLTNQSIVLSNRLLLWGTVQDSEHNRIPDVIVQARRLASVISVEDGVIRTYEGLTDESGSFELALDSGLYNVTFIPPAASGLPRTLPQRVYMIDNDVEMNLTATTLSAPAVVQGNVMDWQGNPMCGVTIEVFRSTEIRADLIGQTISSDEDGVCTGSFAVTIPDSFITYEQ